MRFLLNSIPLLLLAGLIACLVGIYSLGWPIGTTIPLLISSLVTFIVSLAWRATPAGFVRNINGILFACSLLLSALLIADPGTIRTLWFFLTIAVFASIHGFLFEIARVSHLFSGVRIVLLMLPLIVNAIVVAGLYLWNGSLTLASIGFLIAVIFALLATLFGRRIQNS